MPNNPSTHNQRNQLYFPNVPFIFQQDRIVLSFREISLTILYLILIISGIVSSFAIIEFVLHHLYADDFNKLIKPMNNTENINITAN